MDPTQCNKPADPGSGETVPSEESLQIGWRRFGQLCPAPVFERSPDSAKLSRTNLFRTAHFEKNQFESFQPRRLYASCANCKRQPIKETASKTMCVWQSVTASNRFGQSAVDN
jgi:hypothetical protein